MLRLYLSSVVTFGILISLLLFPLILALLLLDIFSLLFSILLVIIVGVVMILVSPAITDLINRHLYKTTFLTEEDFKSKHPQIHAFIRSICDEYRFPFPKIGIIDDRNPTAYTYGTARYNGRVIFTKGIFEFLSTEEAKAVAGHEMGHIVHRDTLVIMVASTILQVLYLIYATLIRARGRKAGAIKLVGLVSYVLYIIATYLVLYLCRIREKMADHFSAYRIDSHHLITALVKIGYGILVVDDDKKTKKMLEGTRHMGIVDTKSAKHAGVINHITHMNRQLLSEVMAYDVLSPWPKLLELNSTHPIIGKRLYYLSELSKTSPNELIEPSKIAEQFSLKKATLWSRFMLDLIMLVLPHIVAVIIFLWMGVLYGFIALLVGLTISLLYRFPQNKATDSTILDEMKNPYQSPVRGRKVRLSGTVIGRGFPGFIFGDDMMFKDSGGIIKLFYTSLFGFLGNFFFAIKKIKKFIGAHVTCEGWFFRGMTSWVALSKIQTNTEKVDSHPALYLFFKPILIYGLIVLIAFWLGFSL